MKRTVIAACFACLAAQPVMAQVSSNPGDAPAGAYRLEGPHSQILFSIVHAGLTDYYGRFDKVSGTLNFDPAALEKSGTAITVDMASASTPSDELNTELQSADVFDAARFPSATFKSTSVTRTGANTGTITGNLTLHGVTKPVTLNATFSGGEPSPVGNSYALGFRATGTIRRTDFGITGMRWEPLVGNDVNLIIEAMFDSEKH